MRAVEHAAHGAERDRLAAAHAHRLAAIDSLLPEPAPPEAHGDDVLLAEPAGAAVAGMREVPADSPESLWRPLREHRLRLWLSGADQEATVGALLDQWERRLEADGRRGDWETAATVVQPSREAAGVNELRRHGFAAGLVLAARPAGRYSGPAEPTPGVRIRRAGADDVDTVAALQLEMHGYDAQFGNATARGNAAELVEAGTREALRRPEPPVWIAELYGKPLGMLELQLPPDSDWLAGYAAGGRLGYLSTLSIAAPARSSGVGTALIAHAHDVLDQERVDVALLHHVLANPRSTPFWYSHGYRPLWTHWSRRPAVR